MTILVLADEHPTARKQHHCHDCGRTIEPGEQYRRQRNIGDGGPYIWKACAHCSALANHIWSTGSIGAWDTDYGLYLPDYLCDEPGETVYDMRVTLQFRRKWRDRNGRMYPVPSWAAEDGTA